MDALSNIVNLWLSKIDFAKKRKEIEFAKDARDAMKFYNGPHDFIYEQLPENVKAPGFKITINKVAELVQLFLPFLLHRNPTRTVAPRRSTVPPELLMMLGIDPNMLIGQKAQDTLRANMIEWYLNQTPRELGLKREMRMSITEALIKGRGLAWTEVFPSPSGGRLIGTFYGSVDELQIDPDVTMVRDAKWAARLRIMPTWEWEQRYMLPAGSLRNRGNLESYSKASEVDALPDGVWDRKTGGTNDLLIGWEIYSRMGLGFRMSGVDEEFRDAVETFGDGVFLAICPGIPFPLNLPPHAINSPSASQEVPQRLAWPIPFHRDTVHPWSFTPLDFHYVPNRVWPMSHIKPAMGQQKFLNWAYAFLAAKMRVTGRQTVVVDDGLDEEALSQFMSPRDLEIVKLKMKPNEKVGDKFQVVNYPAMNGDFYNVVSMVERSFELATGMTPLLYGATSSQMRSATEASVLDKNTSIRPDDMQQTTEDWASRAARNEAIAARYALTGEDVAPMFGEAYQPENPLVSPYSLIWDQFVHSDDINRIITEFEYSIEAGSSRKPNLADQQATIDESAQVILPTLMQVYTATGDPKQVNAWLQEWARTRGFDVDKFMLPPMQMMQQPQPEQQAA